MTKVFILTEGGKKNGFGHITRCLSIYQAFEEINIMPNFIINTNDNISFILSNENYFILNWINNIDSFLNEINKDDIVIIDSYIADLSIYEKVSLKIKVFAFFDDNNRLNYPRGILINGAIFSKEIKYPKNENIEYFLGTDYITIRKDFWNNEQKNIKENIESIMVIFGGTDIKNITHKVLKSLTLNFPNIIKNVIVNHLFNNLEEIKINSDKNTNLIFSPTIKELKNIMIESDISISAAGQTLYELAIIGIPTIMVSVADNQNNNILSWQKTGIIYFAGNYDDNLITNNIVKSIHKLENRDVRIKKSNDSKNLINTNGSNKIVKGLMAKI